MNVSKSSFLEKSEITSPFLARSETNFHVSKETLAAICELRSMFIITLVDKNPQSLAFMCPTAHFNRARGAHEVSQLGLG